MLRQLPTVNFAAQTQIQRQVVVVVVGGGLCVDEELTADHTHFDKYMPRKT